MVKYWGLNIDRKKDVNTACLCNPTLFGRHNAIDVFAIFRYSLSTALINTNII